VDGELDRIGLVSTRPERRVGVVHSNSYLGSRSLSTAGVLGQSLAIGPIFSAGFLSGTIAVFAGFNTPLSVLIAVFGTVALAYVLTLYARRYAGAGAIYEYLARGAHSSLGIVAGGTYVLGLLLLGAGGGFVGEGYLVDRLLADKLSIHLGWTTWALVSLVLVIAINVKGVRIGIRAIVITAFLSLIPFLLIAAVIIAKGGAHGNSLAVFDPGQTSRNAVFHGVLFAVSLFIGFETVTALGEEAKLPRRSIPVAMIASILLAGGFYLLVCYAGAIGFGRGAAQSAWFASGNPFGDLGARYVDPSLGWIVNVTIVLDLFSVCIAYALAASRVLMTLARDGLLPRPLGRTSVRYHTPTGALVAITAWTLIVIGWVAITRYGAAAHLPNVLEALIILSASGSYLITLVYLMLALGGLWLLHADDAYRLASWRLPFVLVAVAVPVLSFDGSLNPLPAYPNSIAVHLAGGAVVAVSGWLVVLRARAPHRVAAAARHADVVAEPSGAAS
jgi:amino acid transporter